MALTPRPYQVETIMKLAMHNRTADLSDPGTGKTFTTGERVRIAWHDGRIKVLLVAAPDSVVLGWKEMFESNWGGNVTVLDCRTGRKDAPKLKEWLLDVSKLPPAKPLHVYLTTVDFLRTILFDSEAKEPRWSVVEGLRGRGVGFIVDESHTATREDSARSRIARAIAWNASWVTALTGTLVGRDKHGRQWGHTALLFPGILAKFKVKEWRQFKARYCDCVDTSGMPKTGGPIITKIYHDDIARDLLAPQQPYTARVTEAEALPFLPPLTIVRRYARLPEAAQKQYTQMRKEGRVVRGEEVFRTPNRAVAAMRCMEMASGWLQGTPLHSAKLQLLEEVLEDTPRCSIWATRMRSLLASALVAAGVSVDEAMQLVAAIPSPRVITQFDDDDDEDATEEFAVGIESTVDPNSKEYRDVVKRAYAGGVGIIHGPTPSKQRDRLLQEWKDGKLQRCVLYPAIGGAGLNLQHTTRAVYVEPCNSVIHRSQSLKRHHRSGQESPVIVTDLCIEGSIEAVVLAEHVAQREAEEAVMRYMANG